MSEARRALPDPVVCCVQCSTPMVLRHGRTGWSGDYETNVWTMACPTPECDTTAEVTWSTCIPIEKARRAAAP